MLRDITETNTVAESAIWGAFNYESLGNETNKEPRTIVDKSDKKSTVSLNSRLGTNEYIDPSKAARVAAWSGQVDENVKVDPNSVAPEAPEQPSGRRRRVAVESDDEEDEETEKPSTPKGTSQVLPRLLTPPLQQVRARGRGPSVAASLVHSNLLQPEISQTDISMVPVAPTHAITATPASVTPDPAFKSRVRVPMAASDTGSAQPTPNESTREHALPSASIGTFTSTTSQPQPAKTAPKPVVEGCREGFADPDELPTEIDVQTRRPKPTPASRALDGPTSDKTSSSSAARSANSYSVSSPSRLETSIIRPIFDPNAYGPKKGAGRGSRKQPSSTKAKAHSRPSKITLPNRPLDSGHTSPKFEAGKGTDTPEPSRIPHDMPRSLFASHKGQPLADGVVDGVRKEQTDQPAQRKPRTRPRGNKQTKQAQEHDRANLVDLSDVQVVQPPTSTTKSTDGTNGAFTTRNQPSVNAGPVGIMDFPATEPQSSAKQKIYSPNMIDSSGPWPKPAAKPQHRDLIDISGNDSTGRDPSPLPPGFDLRVDALGGGPGDATPSLLDPPLQECPPASRGSRSDLMSFSSGSRLPYPSQAMPASQMSRASDESGSYVNTKAYRGPNIDYLAQKSIAALRARQKPNSNVDTRSTMGQMVPNPGKKGLQESKADKKRRQDKALREAYGEPGPIKSQKNDSDISNMSKKKRQMLTTNVNMAVADSEALQVESRQQATEVLKSGLSPIFEASRAFCGELKFEVQIGQILIAPNSSIRDKAITPKKWEKYFGPAAKTPSLTSFTNALTTNGADVDRALEANSFRGGKLWDAASPGQESVSYHFECHSKHGNHFLLVLDQSGQYELRGSGASVIGLVGIHCPAHVWDACAVMQGNENWTASAEIKATVVSFVTSIHVLPNRHELVLIFRQPDDNEIMIKNVTMRRVSRHQCLIPGYEDHQLQATEVKMLYTKLHPDDKKLWQAFERSHINMMQSGFVHYELSVVDRSISAALGGNKFLELGELASPSSGKELLSGDRLKKMIDLIAHMISKIDWMGSRNSGTLARAAAASNDQMMRQQQSLGPVARSKLNPLIAASRMDPSRLGGGSAYQMSSVGGSEMHIGRRNIPGTRADTLGGVYQDEHGYFARGYGGARVPLGNLNVLGDISEAPLEPDDSASQIGGPRRVGPSGMGATRGGGRTHGDKGPGFW